MRRHDEERDLMRENLEINGMPLQSNDALNEIAWN